MGKQFGAGYEPREVGVSLECGIHEATIIKIEEIENDYGKHIEVTLQFGNRPLSYPNKFLIFDRPTEAYGSYSAEQRQEWWDNAQTKMFDNFGITRGDFNFKNWVGKTGKVTVRPQKSNPDYREVVPYEVRPRGKKAETPEAPKEQPGNSAEPFPEDMIF